MLPHPKADFLQEKVMELRQALFFDLSDSVLKLPTSLINALQVDEIGTVWFFITKPSQNVNEFEREFRCRLDFYKKGKSFYLHLAGKACIVGDPEEINNLMAFPEEYRQQLNSGRVILVKMRTEEINYCLSRVPVPVQKPQGVKLNLQPSAFIKTLHYIVKDIIPVFQSH